MDASNVGSRELYSVRSGDYRAIVKIEDDIMIILIIEIGHRSTLYRNLNHDDNMLSDYTFIKYQG
jgi:mRNA-degrading endonuclease RelE of RelBE toxin-antitoxin system